MYSSFPWCYRKLFVRKCLPQFAALSSNHPDPHIKDLLELVLSIVDQQHAHTKENYQSSPVRKYSFRISPLELVSRASDYVTSPMRSDYLPFNAQRSNIEAPLFPRAQSSQSLLLELVEMMNMYPATQILLPIAPFPRIVTYIVRIEIITNFHMNGNRGS